MDSKFLIPLKDYERIFRVIFSVLDGRANIDRACIFFAIAGAQILREHYNLNAVPISGAAAYAVGVDNSLVATFGEIENNNFISTTDAFHCWIECEGYVIDFMSPVFQENLLFSGLKTAIPRRMFQRSRAAMSMFSSFSEIFHEGAFCCIPSDERTVAMLKIFSDKPVNSDLANICRYWYRRPPKKIDHALDMRDDLGRVTHLKLHGPEIVGVW